MFGVSEVPSYSRGALPKKPREIFFFFESESTAAVVVDRAIGQELEIAGGVVVVR